MESQCYSSYWYGLGYGVASNQGDTTTDFQSTAQQNSAYEMPYKNEDSASYLSKDDSDSLEFLENLYLESRDLFKKVVSELGEKQASKKLSTKEEKDARAKVFEKLKKMRLRLQRKMKVQTMQRSLSLGSPRTPRPYGEEESSLKLQRFKVKTLDLGGGAQGKDGQGTTNKFQ